MRRKLRITQACDSCRKRKIRCDNTKPVCSNCKRLDQECSFPRSIGKALRQTYIEERIIWLLMCAMSVSETIGGLTQFSEPVTDLSGTQQQTCTTYYKIVDYLCNFVTSFPSEILNAPEMLTEWPFRYNRAAEAYMRQVYLMPDEKCKLTPDQEANILQKWLVASPQFPTRDLLAALVDNNELLDRSLPYEVWNVYIASIALILINSNLETNSKLFIVSFCQAHKGALSFRHIDPKPVHFRALVLMISATSICGFFTQSKHLMVLAREIGSRLGLHRKEQYTKMDPTMPRHLIISWWSLYAYEANLAMLAGDDLVSLDGVTTPMPEVTSPNIEVLSQMVKVSKLYRPIYKLFVASYEDATIDRTAEVRAIDEKLDAWQNDLPEFLSDLSPQKEPKAKFAAGMHMMQCTMRCILWSKLALVDRNAHASRICEQVARRLIVICENRNEDFGKRYAIKSLHIDFAYGILFLNGVLFPHRRWIYLDIQLAERTIDDLSSYAFPLMAEEIKKSSILHLEILKHVLNDTKSSPIAQNPYN